MSPGREGCAAGNRDGRQTDVASPTCHADAMEQTSEAE